MYTELKPGVDAEGLRVAVAVSRYHAGVTEALKAAAIDRFGEAGGRSGDLTVATVPGAFELTAVCKQLAACGRYDAIVALGCVIAGETNHDRYIASAVAHGLTTVAVETGVPVAFGVLTCASLEQARARAGGAKGNKGAEAMSAAIETARARQALRAGWRA